MGQPVSRRVLIKKFRKLGFDGPFSGGRHDFMAQGSLKVRIPNPHKKDISWPLVNEILHQASISQKDWEAVN